jgi:hypothetical protein
MQFQYIYKEVGYFLGGSILPIYYGSRRGFWFMDFYKTS